MILLDSDILIDLLREYPPAQDWFDTLPDDELVYVSGFVVMELLQGCRNKVEMERIQRLLANYGFIPGISTIQPYVKQKQENN